MYKQEVLVVKGWLGDDKWSLPGGGLHRGEDTVAGAIREVGEEVSVQLKADQLTLLGHAKQTSRGLTYKYFQLVCELHQKPVVKPQALEISDICWMTANELTNENAEPSTIATLQAWSEVANHVRL